MNDWINIVMLVRDRPKMTRQALESLGYSKHYKVLVVDDGSDKETESIVQEYVELGPRVASTLRMNETNGRLGQLRNLGAAASQDKFGKGKYLYFSDNDVYFTRDWVKKLLDVYPLAKCDVLGGSNHPFNHPNSTYTTPYGKVHNCNAVAGYSWLLSWKVWERLGLKMVTSSGQLSHGPFVEDAVGVRKSEDFELCQRIINGGGRVGYVDPPVVIHCGKTDTYGDEVPGANLMKPRIPLFGHSLKPIIIE